MMEKQQIPGAGSKPLNVRIADNVKALIEDLGLRPHEPVPSEGALAKLFGVSKMTTKLALERLASEGVVYRMPRRGTFLSPYKEESPPAEEAASLSAAAESNAGLPAKQTAAARADMIAIVVPNLDDYVSQIVMAVEAEARANGKGLQLVVAGAREDECLAELAKSGVEGIIFYPRDPKTCSDQVLRLKLQSYPIIIIDRIFRDIQIDSVYHDHYKGTYNLVEYLLNKGHRNIGYISSPIDGITSREERYHGYIQAMLYNGLSVNQSYIMLDFNREHEMRFLERNEQHAAYLKLNPEITAVVCANDYFAASLIHTALMEGIAVPKDLSVVGFTDLALSALLSVPLTTARQPTDQLGLRAVRLLLKRINHGSVHPVSEQIPIDIVERESVLDIRLAR
ncbi:substrate-binding domain-containing protein [Paenibacillus sp. NPDC058174]|uniref:substrate-binding domain-containing protein n=1 Tax=Paenibacillus sp. NPDC058174 TaxID=3346366 RepID=UPI0036DEE159